MRSREPSLRPLLFALLGILFTGLVVACMGNYQPKHSIGELLTVPVAPEGYIDAEIALYPNAAVTCQVLIETKSERFEPRSIPTEFLVDGLHVWVKLTTQRRLSSCDATPCEIQDIKKREP